jgi:hypothetical protein
MDQFETGSERTRLRFTWQRRGNDVHVHIAGGEDHIGAVALVGRDADDKLQESVLRISPHKEDEVVLPAARQLHAATGASVCVTAGIHLPEITAAEIKAVLANAQAGVATLICMLEGS